MKAPDYANELATWGVFENTVKRFEDEIKDLSPSQQVHIRELLMERLAYASRDITERLLEDLEAGELELDDLDIED